MCFIALCYFFKSSLRRTFIYLKLHEMFCKFANIQRAFDKVVNVTCYRTSLPVPSVIHDICQPCHMSFILCGNHVTRHPCHVSTLSHVIHAKCQPCPLSPVTHAICQLFRLSSRPSQSTKIWLYRLNCRSLSNSQHLMRYVNKLQLK